MDKKIEKALAAAVEGFSEHGKIDHQELNRELIRVFNADASFMEKVGMLDSTIDNYPAADQIREILFDLLLVNFFTGDVKKLEADYLDSPEWEAIEEETLDRGTEILNLLLYLNECADEGINPELADYLNEFLLVDEDEFQDEHHIYEDIIANQVLVESSYEEIAKVAVKVDDEAEIKELFYPIISFFYEQEPTEEQVETYIRHSESPGFDHAVYAILSTFK